MIVGTGRLDPLAGDGISFSAADFEFAGWLRRRRAPYGLISSPSPLELRLDSSQGVGIDSRQARETAPKTGSRSPLRITVTGTITLQMATATGNASRDGRWWLSVLTTRPRSQRKESEGWKVSCKHAWSSFVGVLD